MSTVATPLMTADEFFDWANQSENRDRHFELERGEIVPMPPPGERHCVVCGNATGLFWNYTRQIGRGRVCPNDMGLILERDPDTVRGPELAIYLSTKKYSELSLRFPADLPDAIVEALSPTDRFQKMLKRIHLFLNKGVGVVMLADPDSQTLSIHRLHESAKVFEIGEEIAGIAELPDFRCKVADYFVSTGE